LTRYTCQKRKSTLCRAQQAGSGTTFLSQAWDVESWAKMLAIAIKSNCARDHHGVGTNVKK